MNWLQNRLIYSFVSDWILCLFCCCLLSKWLIESRSSSCLCRTYNDNIRRPRSDETRITRHDVTYKALCQRCPYVFMLQQTLEISRSSKYPFNNFFLPLLLLLLLVIPLKFATFLRHCWSIISMKRKPQILPKMGGPKKWAQPIPGGWTLDIPGHCVLGIKSLFGSGPCDTLLRPGLKNGSIQFRDNSSSRRSPWSSFSPGIIYDFLIMVNFLRICPVPGQLFLLVGVSELVEAEKPCNR